jgi:Lipocalin-like domain
MFKRIFVAMLVGMSLLTAPRASIMTAAENPLQGAWQVMNPAGGMAGLFIFSGTHYSMMAASTDRPDITDLSKATADEMRALYGPMVGNAGVYEIAGNQVTIRPVVAKIPVVMKPGSYEVYEFKIEDNNLTLTQRRNVRGPVERGNVWTLTRVE